MPPRVVPAAQDAWPALAAVEARGFRDEPPFRDIFPDDHTRADKLLAWFRTSLPGAMRSGFLVETTAAHVALAMWSPPERSSSIWSQIRAAPQVLPQVIRLFRVADRADLRRAVGWGRRIEQRDHELVPEPHWSLDTLAVDPPHQRFGYGAVLVRQGLERADADGLPTYVETNTTRNVAFYEKLGFEVIEHVPEDYPPMKIPTWRMLRQPPSHA